ncbi:MAG: RDD family protein [Bacteroidota bacterium]
MSHHLLDDPNVDPIRYVGFWPRVGASLIDALLLLPFFFISSYNNYEWKSGWILILITLLTSLYKPLMEAERSATVGKMLLGYKVVDAEMNNISLDQAIQRYFPWIISIILAGGMNYELFNSPAFADADSFFEIGLLTQTTTFYLINNIYGFIFMIMMITVAFDLKHQGLHDKVARTYVIEDMDKKKR